MRNNSGFQLDLITLSSQTGKEQQGRQNWLLKASNDNELSLGRTVITNFPEESGQLHCWRPKEVSTQSYTIHGTKNSSLRATQISRQA